MISCKRLCETSVNFFLCGEHSSKFTAEKMRARRISQRVDYLIMESTKPVPVNLI